MPQSMNQTLSNNVLPGPFVRSTHSTLHKEPSSIGHRPAKPGYYLMRLRLQYAQNGIRPLAKILSHNCNIPAPPS